MRSVVDAAGIEWGDGFPGVLDAAKLWQFVSLESLQVRTRESSLLTTYCSESKMIWWTGLVPSEFESPFLGSLTSTFQGYERKSPATQLVSKACRPDSDHTLKKP